MWLSPGQDFDISMLEWKKAKEELKEQQKVYSKKKSKTYKKRYGIPNSKFNPNKYQVSDWMQLGLSKKQSEIVVSFAKRGIKSNTELKKIFVIPDALYELIKDSTQYPVIADKSYNDKPEIQVRELNKATREDLMELPGIGKYYAEKIIEHRENLGGYVSIEQLLEIWKFDQSKISQISNYVNINPDAVRKIDINSITVDELKSHPYLSYKVANSIVKYRESHGTYKKVSEIKNSVLVDEELYMRISPYLKID